MFTHTQLFIKHQVRRIYDVVDDLPTLTRRSRRGFLTDALSHLTGLATKEYVHAITHVLHQVEKGICESARLWGDGARSLTAAFKVEQRRMHNVSEILNTYRKTIRSIQYDFMHLRQKARHTLHWHTIVVAKALHFLSNTTVQLTEIRAVTRPPNTRRHRVIERHRREWWRQRRQGGNAVGVTIEAPKAPRGWGVGRGVPHF